jgi:4-amino-4-deoxy-L-arabinose transferase-like glycosyltransferase
MLRNRLSLDSSNDARRAPAVVLSIALLVYALVLFVVIPALSRVLGPRYGIGFADDYDLLANSLALGQGYRFGPDLPPTLLREPGYPLFLAGVFALFGYSIEAARFANLVLAGGAAVLVMRLARVAGLGRGAATLAAAIFLAHPGTLIAAARGGFEIFFVFLLLLFLLALARATQGGTAKHYVLAGFFLGLAALTRSTVLLFPVVALGYLLLTARGAGERVRYCVRFAVLLAIAAAVMSPWAIRNYRVAGEFIPTSTVQGVAAQTGLHICKGLSFDRGLQELDIQAAAERDTLARRLGHAFHGGYYQYFHTTRGEVAFNRYLLGEVIGEYRSDPLLWMKCAGQNLFNFWFAGKTWQVTAMNMALQVPFLMLAVFGAYWLWRTGQSRGIALPGLFILYLYALHVPIHAQARYSVPLVALLAIVASAGIVGLLRTRYDAPKAKLTIGMSA